MYELALGLSIVSSLLLIVYLLGIIFGNRKTENDITIKVSGRIITTTVNQSGTENASTEERRHPNPTHQTIEGEVVSINALQKGIQAILSNLK